MNVLSLFDGISCGRVALERANITVTKYYASEIDNNAIKVSKNNHKDIIHIGDVNNVSYKDGWLITEQGDFNVGKIDLLIGGSPCQDFSPLQSWNGGTKGLNGDKSKLFMQFLRLKNEINPRYFLLENVKMKNKSKQELDDYLGVCGILINSELVSFQKRPRFYWSNIDFAALENKNVSFQDYKCTENLDGYAVNKTPSRIKMWNDGKGRDNIKSCKNITHAEKIGCLTLKQDRAPNSGLIEHGDFCRYLTIREMELAQTLPIGYVNGLSYRQACSVLGNGWTVDVITHILKNMVISDYKE